jgi:hypothetical protein
LWCPVSDWGFGHIDRSSRPELELWALDGMHGWFDPESMSNNNSWGWHRERHSHF